MTQYNIDSVDNYLTHYNATTNELFTGYLNIIKEFIAQSGELVCLRNINYFKNVVIKGIETLTHAYRYLLLYTKNIELANYNCKKAIFYYVEFISQLGDDKQDSLKLTINDAVFFVYKKTIFEISQSFRKDYNSQSDEQSNIITDNLFCMTEIYLSCFRNIIDKYDTFSLEHLYAAIRESNDFAQEIINISHNVDATAYNRKATVLLKFSNCINCSNMNNKYDLLKLLIKKIKKIDISLENINEAVSYAKNYAEPDTTSKQIVILILSKCVIIK